MKISEFLNLYSKDPFVSNIIHSIKGNNHNLTIKNIKGSLLSIISTVAFQKNLKKQIIVLPEKEEAEYVFTDLLNLFKNQNVFFFPEIQKSEFSKSSYNLLSRTEITNLSESDNFIIVTYPSAFFNKIEVSKNDDNYFYLKKGKSIQLNILKNDLIDRNFKRVDAVTEPGEYSIRGGIVDIFSFAKKDPIRLEFFGDIIESIRFFNTDTQISIQEVDEIKIVNENTSKDKKYTSFFKLFDKKTLLWFKNFDTILDELEDKFEAIDPKDANIYEGTKTFLDSLQDKKTIKLLSNETCDLEYDSILQGSHNNNFEILCKELEEYQKKDFKIFISSEHFKYTDEIKEIIQNINNHLEINTLKIGLYKGFADNILKIVCFTDHQILGRFYQHKHKQKNFSKDTLTLKQLYNLNIGDYIVHIDHGIGQFSGIQKIENNGRKQEVIRLNFHNNDLVYVNVQNLYKISKYSNVESKAPKLSKLGSKTWENKKKNVKKKIQDIAEDLIALYSKRKNSKGYEFKRDDIMQISMESSFIYEETPDQARAIDEVKKDMEKAYPMDRLICGDVGFGKTEIAMRAAFKAVNSNKQVAVLAPTTILTLQHYKSFKKRLKKFPVVVDYINRFRSTKEKNQILADLKKGTIDILIGTHGIINPKVTFKDLGLLIIDEEQKFGVKTKEQIKKLKVNVDVLTLTATPIPRTLQFSLMGARDLSIIFTPPPNRQPIETRIIKFQKHIIANAIEQEIQRDGQIFFVHNRVKDIEDIANYLRSLAKSLNIGVVHGQMESKLLEKQLLKFIKKEYDILVSTNIIESGLDIPNANTIFINNAQNFGLSDLHQMRGRTGRSNRKAFCYLVIPSMEVISADSKKRISALEELSNIGDGFKIAMRDLDIRGAGNLLGGEQSGFIEDIGYELYQKILDDAVGELKEGKYKNVFSEHTQISKKECLIETDLEAYIPEDYISNEAERISFYIKIDKIEKREEINDLKIIFKDRYGTIPEPLLELLKLIPIRKLAAENFIEKLKLKEGNLKFYFNKKDLNAKKPEIIDKIIAKISESPDRYKFKETDKSIIFSILEVQSLDKCMEMLKLLVV